jgi:heme-degrading monooxygenase HmoA
MAVEVVRATLRDDIALSDFGKLEEKMLALVSSMPDFQESKEFKADDGESMMLASFETRADMTRWRDYPNQSKARRRGRERYCSGYDVKICEVAPYYFFSNGERAEQEIRGLQQQPDLKASA